MQWSRRGMMLGGAALAAGCATSKPMVSRMSVIRIEHPSATAQVAPAARASVAAAGPRMDPQGLIRRSLLDDGLAALDSHGRRIAHKDRMYLVDFARHSGQPRLYQLDLVSGRVTSFHTAHGRGSDPAHTGFAKTFSNRPNSYASSVGAYVTAGEAWGAKHGPNVLLEGLDPTNSQAREREIIVHAAEYCEPGYLARFGKLGRSNGCFSLSGKDLMALRPAMDAGRLLFGAA